MDPGVERGRTMVCLQMAPWSWPLNIMAGGSHWMMEFSETPSFYMGLTMGLYMD